MSKLDEAAEKLYEAAWGAGLDQYDRKAITRAAIDAIVAACVEKLAEARNHEYGRQHDKSIMALYERIEALTAEVERWKNAWTRSESELARMKETAKDPDGERWGIWCVGPNEPGCWMTNLNTGNLILSTRSEAEKQPKMLGAWTYEPRPYRPASTPCPECVCSAARRAETDHPPDCKANRRDAVPTAEARETGATPPAKCMTCLGCRWVCNRDRFGAPCRHGTTCKSYRRPCQICNAAVEQWRLWNLKLGCWAILGSWHATKEDAQRECDVWNGANIFQYEPRIYRPCPDCSTPKCKICGDTRRVPCDPDRSGCQHAEGCIGTVPCPDCATARIIAP